MATPAIYDFDVIGAEYKKLREQAEKDKAEIDKQRSEGPVAPATPNANADDFIYGCGFPAEAVLSEKSIGYSASPPYRILP